MISNRCCRPTTQHNWPAPRQVAALLTCAWIAATAVHAWSPQGHRLVALVATNHLTPTARQNVSWLLGSATLADVAVWADEYLEGNNQTSFWHYVNIPLDATNYERDRDCPRQPGVSAGGRGDRWRDCVVDRILYNQERLANPSLDRADRTIALKFLVHFIADLHQPYHALGVERGGNGILVSAFGSPTCSYDDRTPYRAIYMASGTRNSSLTGASTIGNMLRNCNAKSSSAAGKRWKPARPPNGPWSRTPRRRWRCCRPEASSMSRTSAHRSLWPRSVWHGVACDWRHG